VPDGTLIRKLEGHETTVDGVAFSPDGQLLAAAAGKVTFIWGVG